MQLFSIKIATFAEKFCNQYEKAAYLHHVISLLSYGDGSRYFSRQTRFLSQAILVE